MQPSEGGMNRQIGLLAGAALAAAILSTVTVLDFYAQNAAKLPGPGRVVRYFVLTLLAVALVTALVKVCLKTLPLWRAILAVGIGAFVFFSFHRIEPLEVALHVDHNDWAAGLWIAISVLTVLGALIFVRRPAAVSIVLVLSLAFATPSIARVVALVAAGSDISASPNGRPLDGHRAMISPNIYWIVLDGYPRGDVLQENFGFNNDPFLNLLRSLGFRVVEHGLSNFPVTANSISSTLNMDYTVRPEEGAIRPFSMPDLYSIVKGNSRTVSTLRGLGYNYVHFENGYDYLTKCAEDEQRCVRGNQGLDEQDVVFLSNTPIIDLISGLEGGGTDASSVFQIGGVGDLTAKLHVIQRTPAPFFVYAHVIAPHPPIRFRADCSMRPAEPDLQTWSARVRPDFVEQLKCVNAQAEILLRRIDQTDPDAIIIVQSDHGTAFNGQFGKKASEWSDSDLRERFGALNAMRLPAACRGSIATDLTLVDTFPLVLSCLTGSEFKRHPGRFFVTPYDDSPEFGEAIEYAPARLQQHLEARVP
jgi:hypothetical protein